MAAGYGGQDIACSERRLLLEYVLKDFAKRGGHIRTPAATAFNHPGLLDSLDVAAVLRLLPITGVPLDLSKLTRTSNGGHGIVKSTPPPAVTLQAGGVGADGIPTYTYTAASRSDSLSSANGGGTSNPCATPVPEPADSSKNPFLSDSPAHRLGTTASGTTQKLPAPVQNFAKRVGHQRVASEPPAAFTQSAQPRPSVPPPRVVQAPNAYPPLPTLAPEQTASDAGAAHNLQIPLLRTGIAEDHLKELAFLMFSAACPQQLQSPAAVPGGLPRPPMSKPSSVMSDTAGLLTALRGQLELDESTARDVTSVLRHVSTGYWTPQRRCSLEGLMVLLAQARPNDFNMLGGGSRGFRGWVRWRQGLSAVLAAAAQHKHAALQHSQESKRLLARLKGALRRLDVPSAEELDEEEYNEAAAAMKDAVRGLAFCGIKVSAGELSMGTLPPAPGGGWANFDGQSPSHSPYHSSGGGALQPNGGATMNGTPVAVGLPVTASGQLDGTLATGAGWHLPWAVRACLAQVLLDAMFDTINEGTYIDEVNALQSALDNYLWPALGVSPTLALSLAAWIHFRQYLATGQPWLARQLKLLISKLCTNVTAIRQNSLKRASSTNNRPGHPAAAPGATPAASIHPLTPDDEADADSQVAAQVGRLVVEHLLERLADYHATFPPGQEQAFQVMLDTAVSAARARGDGDAAVCSMLSEVVGVSVARQWARCAETEPSSQDDAAEQDLLAALAAAEEVAHTEGARYGAILAPHLPHHMALVAARLHSCVGERLLPWLRRGVTLGAASVDVLRAAVRLDTHFAQQVQHTQQLLGTQLQAAHKGVALPTDAASGPLSMEAAQVMHDALRSFLRWELDIPTQHALEKWVAGRVQSMHTWVDRQLGMEKWQPCNNQDGFSQSSVEVVSLVLETLDALFNMQLPVPRSTLTTLLAGIDTAICKYARYILEKMASPGRLIPPTPIVTRFKKPFVVKQEELEAELVYAANPGLGKRPKSKVSMTDKMKKLMTPSPSSKPDGKTGADEQTGFLESVPPIQSQPEYAALKLFTPTVMACFIMSAHHLAEKLDWIAQTVCSKWQQPGAAQTDGSWVPGCFQSCRQQLSQVIATSCVFLATKAVFWDMRYEWLEQLYRHHVPSKSGSVQQLPPYSCRIDPLFTGLNKVLSEACAQLPDNLRAAVAKELLAAAAAAWQRVLLDGGPCRWFIPADVTALQEDLQALHHLFTADGEGLLPEVVDPILRPCRRLLILVGCELSQLISLLRTARLHGKATLALPGHAPEVFDEAVLMRMLARRPDRTGSKLLKKEYKMGRRLKT